MKNQQQSRNVVQPITRSLVHEVKTSEPKPLFVVLKTRLNSEVEQLGEVVKEYHAILTPYTTSPGIDQPPETGATAEEIPSEALSEMASAIFTISRLRRDLENLLSRIQL